MYSRGSALITVAALFPSIILTASTYADNSAETAEVNPVGACNVAESSGETRAGDNDCGRRLLVWRQRVQGASDEDEDLAQVSISKRGSDSGSSVPPLQSEEEYDKDFVRDDQEETEHKSEKLGTTGKKSENLGATGKQSKKQNYDCSEDAEQWQLGWSDAKKLFCCKNKGIGCSKPSAPAAAPKLAEELAKSPTEESVNTSTESAKADESSKKVKESSNTEDSSKNSTEPVVAANPAKDRDQADEQEVDEQELDDGKTTFDCGVGYTNREKGWSKLKKTWCCKQKLVGCKFDCKAGEDGHEKGWSDVKVAYCCYQHNIGCAAKDDEDDAKKPPSGCVTREDPLAKYMYFLGTVSKPGTPCIFGKDDRDEGRHCILDDGKYGEFGWCYTADGWGSCSKDCPLFGPSRVLYEHLLNLSRQLTSPNQALQNATEEVAQNSTAKVDESNEEAGKVEEKPSEGDAKKVVDGKTDSDGKKDTTEGAEHKKGADTKKGDTEVKKGSDAKQDGEEKGGTDGKGDKQD